MDKKFNIEQLPKRNPFKTPANYFDDIASRVMSQIPEGKKELGESEAAESKKKAKVVGLMPHKRDTRWVKWGVAIAACVCGVVLFLTNNNEDDNASQIANVKTDTKAIKTDETISAEESNQDLESATPSKQYANAAFDLSQRRKNSTYQAEPSRERQYTAYTPAKAEHPVGVTTQIETISTNNAKTSPVAEKSPESQLATSTTTSSTSTTSQSSLAAVLDNMNDYDLLDYTQMSGSEIYDYLAGNDYY